VCESQKILECAKVWAGCAEQAAVVRRRKHDQQMRRLEERLSGMEIFKGKEDLRVVIRTPSAAILDARVTQLETEGRDGRIVVRAGSEPTMMGLTDTELKLRKSDGSEIMVRVDWGSLVAIGKQARIVVESASVRYLEPLPIAV
jgi:hypothetical protein